MSLGLQIEVNKADADCLKKQLKDWDWATPQEQPGRRDGPFSQLDQKLHKSPNTLVKNSSRTCAAKPSKVYVWGKLGWHQCLAFPGKE